MGTGSCGVITELVAPTPSRLCCEDRSRRKVAGKSACLHTDRGYKQTEVSIKNNKRIKTTSYHGQLLTNDNTCKYLFFLKQPNITIMNK